MKILHVFRTLYPHFARFLLALAFLLAACAPVTQMPPTMTPTQVPPTPVPTPVPPTSTPAPTDPQALEGDWMSLSTSEILAIHNQEASMYHLIQNDCIGPYWSAQLGQRGSDTTYMELKLSLQGEKLDFALLGYPPHLYWTRIPDLPDACKTGKALKTQDPVVNFEVFWKIFQQQYPYFEVRNVDWQAQYDKNRPKIKADMSEYDLFNVMAGMLLPLNETNACLFSPSREYCAGMQPVVPDLSYINKNVKKTDSSGYGLGLMWYAKLTDSIGYLQINKMEGYDPQQIYEAAAVGSAIDQALEGLGDVKALIVDIRKNPGPGGGDPVSLALAGRFTDQRRLAYSYATRKGEAFTTIYEAYVEPAGKRPFTKPVFLLTSGYTANSAETFALAMRALPNVKIIGEKTRGMFGGGFFTLPNDWGFLMSYCKVIAADGKAYEGVGIPPDIAVPLNNSIEKDDILEKAISLAGEVK